MSSGIKVSNYAPPGSQGIVLPSTPGNTAPVSASRVTYDNGTSGLASTDVQDAIDELALGGIGPGSGDIDITTLAGLDDVDVSGVGDGDVLTYDTGSGLWIPGSGSTIADIVDIPTAETDTSLVLAPDGVGGVEWVTPSGGPGGGGLVLLEQHTANNTSPNLDFTTAISSTYDDYLLELVGMLPATDGAIPGIRVGTGGGPTWDTGSNYGWTVVNHPFGAGGVGVAGNTVDSGFYLFNAGQSSSYPLGMSVNIWDPGNASYRKFFAAQGPIVYSVGPAEYWLVAQGAYNPTTAITAVRFFYSTGNIAAGTARMYGLAK